jgi:hypothetical protein
MNSRWKYFTKVTSVSVFFIRYCENIFTYVIQTFWSCCYVQMAVRKNDCTVLNITCNFQYKIKRMWKMWTCEILCVKCWVPWSSEELSFDWWLFALSELKLLIFFIFSLQECLHPTNYKPNHLYLRLHCLKNKT